MKDGHARIYWRLRWPEPVVPTGEPTWLLYEIDQVGDIVTRWVEIFPNGTVRRNSLEIETAQGYDCPSLVGDSIANVFRDTTPEDIIRTDFETEWARGVDTPFWFPRSASPVD